MHHATSSSSRSSCCSSSNINRIAATRLPHMQPVSSTHIAVKVGVFRQLKMREELRAQGSEQGCGCHGEQDALWHLQTATRSSQELLAGEESRCSRAVIECKELELAAARQQLRQAMGSEGGAV